MNNNKSTNRLRKNWQDALINADSTIEQAIQNLNMTGLKLCLVIDESSRLIGTVSDGDIRRGLLVKLQLNESVTKIIQRSPITLDESSNNEYALSLMLKSQVQHIPILNQDLMIKGLYCIEDMISPQPIENPFVIMAGGRGQRLMPETARCPKPMLELSGKPILEKIILKARAEGFNRFYISVNYLGHIIKDYFEDGSKFNNQISYIEEDIPAGTAGALNKLDIANGFPIVVTNGDVLTDISYRDILTYHQNNNSAATVAVRHHEWQNPFGVISVDSISHEIKSIIEKPVIKSIISSGVYVLNGEVLRLIISNEYLDMPELLQKSINAKMMLMAYHMHEPWVDIGTTDDLRRVRNSLISGENSNPNVG